MKQKISIASGSLKPKDMSRNHYTTLGFGSIFPVYCEEVVPKDKVNCRVTNFSRLAPMILPNLGTLQMKLHAFYVPFRLVWNHFDNFKEGLPSWNSNGAQVYKSVPHINDVWLTKLFYNFRKNAVVEAPLQNWLCEKVNVTDVTDGGFDFRLVVDNTVEYYRLSKLGKDILHVLYALGYNFNWTLQNEFSGTRVVTDYSLLPILCWLKVYNDYFIPSQLQPSSHLNEILANLHDLTASDTNSVLSESFLYTFYQSFAQSQYFYQNNYFTSAWQTPNSPLEGLNNIGNTSSDYAIINSISAQGSQRNQISQPVTTNSNGVMPQNVSAQALSNQYQLSADGLSFLQKFARFIKRSNFAGSRAIERILARYGVRVDDFQIGMCKYLGSDSIILQKADVTVTGNTEEAGEYKGKGWFTSPEKVRSFKCDCDYFGMFIVTSSIETPSMYVTGVRRRNMRIYPLDYWTPELDGGTMEAIAGSELYGRDFATDAAAPSLNSLGLVSGNVFGFSPKYSSYKTSIDDITGDFTIPRLKGNIQNFILPREIFDLHKRYLDYVQAPSGSHTLTDYLYDSSYVAPTGAITEFSPIKTLFGNDMYQFNRIFENTTGFNDPIFSVFKIDCVINSPTLPLDESSELIGKGKIHEFETNGKHL